MANISCAALHFILLLTYFILLSANRIEAKYTEANNHDAVIKFLKDLRAKKWQEISRDGKLDLTTRPEANEILRRGQWAPDTNDERRQTWTPEFAEELKAFNFDELEDSELPLQQVVLNEWILNQVKG